MSTDVDNMIANPPLLPEDRKHGQSLMIRVAMTGSVMYTSIIGTTISTQYMLAVDAAKDAHIVARDVGLLQTLMSLAPLATLLGANLMPRLGKIGSSLLGRWLAVPLVCLMIALAAFGAQGTAGVIATMLGLSVLSACYAMANTAWWPLLQDIIGPDPAGNYLARLRTRLRSVEIGLPLLVGLYLGQHPPLQKFLLPFGLSLVALVVGTLWMRRVPSRAVMAPRVSLGLRLRLAARSASVRRILWFLGVFSMVLGMFWSFAMVLLTNKPGSNPFPGLPEGFVLAMIAVAAIGHMVSLRIWGSLVDRHGSRSVNTLSLVGTGLLGLAWLALPTHQPLLMAWTIGFYLAWGFFEGGSLMGRTHAMLRAVPDVYQADGFTLVTLVGALGGALGAYLGGLTFGALTSWVSQAQLPAFFDARKLYLALVQLGFLGAWLLSRRFVGHSRQTPTRQLLGLVKAAGADDAR